MRMLQKIAGALLVLVALVVGVVLLLGANLPEQHSATVTLHLDRPTAEVWDLVRYFEGQPEWRPGVTGMERLADREGQPVYRESSEFGTISYRIESEDPPRRLVTRIVDNEEFGGTWTYEVSSRDGGRSTIITITEDGEIRSLLFRVVTHYVTGYDATLNVYADALKDALGSFVASSFPSSVGAGGRASLYLHGKIVDPPYDVRYDEHLGEVTINGVSIHRKQKVPKIQVTESARKQYHASQRMRDRYREAIDAGARHEDALDAFIECAEKEDCVASAKRDSDDPHGILVLWTDGSPEWYFLRPEPPPPQPSPAEIEERRVHNLRQVVMTFRSALRRGRTVHVHSAGSYSIE